MRRETEPDPRQRIALRMPGALPYFRENSVVRVRVVPEICLDARERGIEQSLACEHQGLQRARHAAIAIRERVDHHEVQMGERRPRSVELLS